MRFDLNDSFGYPVLRPENDDYVGCAIQSSLNAVADADLSTVTVSYQISISAPEINKLISENKVELLIYGECRDTWFDIVHYPQTKDGTFSISGNKIEGEFVLTCIVVAKEKIKSYRSIKFNPEYGGAKFDIERGDILAFDNPQSFYITRDTFRNITSLFDYSANVNISVGEWDVSLDSDRIKVEVNPIQLPILRTAEGTNKNKAVLLSGIFLPIVIQIINEMNNNSEEYGDLKWFKVIEQKRVSLQHSIAKNPVRVAQALLKHPLLKLNTSMGWVE
jgi:hypothetical protein